MKELRCVFQTQTPFHHESQREERERARSDHLNTAAGKRVRAIWDRMSLSISCVMKND